jgi:predicted ABC-type ATPase
LKKKQIWLLAGGNGAGKTTFYNTQLKPMKLPFINADNIARELFPQNPEQHSYQAASIAEEVRNRLVEEGKTFCFETVFSHPSKVDFLAKAKAYNYEIVLVFIHLSSIDLNKARISQRIEEGGHFVPDEKVETRIPRTLENIKTAIQLVDQAYLLDNSDSDRPFEQVAVLREQQIEFKVQPIPEWAFFLLSDLAN